MEEMAMELEKHELIGQWGVRIYLEYQHISLKSVKQKIL